MRSQLPVLILFALFLSGCESDQLRTFSYIKDFSIDTLATDTLTDVDVQELHFYGYRNQSFYLLPSTGPGDTLIMFGRNGSWSTNIRQMEGFRFLNNQIQFVNSLGRLVVLDALSGEVSELISPATGLNFKFAFSNGDSVYAAFRDNDKLILGGRPANSGEPIMALATIADSRSEVIPQHLNFYEKNNQLFAIWYCTAQVQGTDSYYIVKGLGSERKLWLFPVKNGGPQDRSFIADGTFYYSKEPDVLRAYSLTGDSLVWDNFALPGKITAANSTSVYLKDGNNLIVLEKQKGEIISRASGIDSNHYFEDDFILHQTEMEFQILDPENLRELKVYPIKPQFTERLGYGLYLFNDTTTAIDTSFLHLIKIKAR